MIEHHDHLKKFSVRDWSSKNLIDDQGGIIVEFALVCSVFFLFVLGVLELGRALWIYNTVAEAAHAAARYAIVRGATTGNPSGIATQATVQSFVQAKFGKNLTVSMTPSVIGLPGSTVLVQVSASLPPLIPLVGLKSLTLMGTSKMRVVY